MGDSRWDVFAAEEVVAVSTFGIAKVAADITCWHHGRKRSYPTQPNEEKFQLLDKEISIFGAS